MPGALGRREPEQARAVLRYFVRHPEAADSFEGIVTFRLLEATVQRHVEEVREALDWLVEQGFLDAVPTRASRVARETNAIFSLNHDRRLEAERFLSEPAPGRAER
jgi:hypothetical protein